VRAFVYIDLLKLKPQEVEHPQGVGFHVEVTEKDALNKPSCCPSVAGEIQVHKIQGQAGSSIGGGSVALPGPVKEMALCFFGGARAGGIGAAGTIFATIYKRNWCG
jgi:hypothetical protein